VFYIAAMLFDSGGNSYILLKPSLMDKTAAEGIVFAASEARFGLLEIPPFLDICQDIEVRVGNCRLVIESY
jgi:hypothetical protein